MSKTILLADDSVTIQKVIELTFMDEDYEVVSASNGEQALERLDEVTPDVVIADVHMPGASGFDVAKRSKQLHPQVPVLLLVGTFEPFDEGDFSASGADAYLKKPFDSQELLQRVNGLLEAAPAAAPPPPYAGVEAEGEPATLEEEPSWSTDEPLLTPEDEPAVSPPVEVAGPSESLLPPVSEDTDTDWRPRAGSDARADEPTEEAEDAWDLPAREDLGTRAVPGLAGREWSRPAPAEEAEEGAEEPFPELSAPAAPAGRRSDLFGDLDEGDGSTEVKPPPDLLEDDEDFTSQAESSTLAAPPSEAPRVVGEPPHAAAPATGTAAPEAPGERPVEIPPAPAAPVDDSEVAEPPAPAAGRSGLSGEDIDRIARRVVELMGEEVLREVAWEVVPDLAEVVIKDRLRELESQVEEG